jgi:hypothetical protein
LCPDFAIKLHKVPVKVQNPAALNR